MTAQPLGPILHSYFLDHLIAVKGLRPGSVRSYRDTIRPAALVPRRREALQDHTPNARRSHPRADHRVPAPPRREPRQPHQHPQPATRRDPQPVRIHRLALARDARGLPASRRDPDETHRPTGNALPRTRRSPDAAAPHAEQRTPRAPRPGADPIPLQHRRARPRGRRPATGVPTASTNERDVHAYDRRELIPASDCS
jgi:hypothetical protein